MGLLIKIDGDEYRSDLAFLVMSLDQRRAVSRKLRWECGIVGAVLPKDPRAQAVACEMIALGYSAKEALAEVFRRAASSWPDTLSLKHTAIRLFFDEMYQGPTDRDAPGFRSAHLELIEREIAAKGSAEGIACALWRLERVQARVAEPDSTTRPPAPALHLLRGTLPVGVEASSTVSPARPHEPLIVVGQYAYAVSDAIMVLPRADVKAFADEVGKWMAEHWPTALVACDDAGNRVPGYALDRRNVELAAEAFARGLMLRESAEFIFSQRVREFEAVA
jgi:hypothetical protein